MFTYEIANVKGEIEQKIFKLLVYEIHEGLLIDDVFNVVMYWSVDEQASVEWTCASAAQCTSSHH